MVECEYAVARGISLSKALNGIYVRRVPSAGWAAYPGYAVSAACSLSILASEQLPSCMQQCGAQDACEGFQWQTNKTSGRRECMLFAGSAACGGRFSSRDLSNVVYAKLQAAALTASRPSHWYTLSSALVPAAGAAGAPLPRPGQRRAGRALHVVL